MTTPTLIFDFDSTVVAAESVELLAAQACKGRKDSAALLEKISRITNAGMEGTITIQESLRQRLKLIDLREEHVKAVAKRISMHITKSFLRNAKSLRHYGKNIFIVSSGFRELILPVAQKLGIPASHVLANDLIFNSEGVLVGLDPKNPLAGEGGKTAAISALNLPKPVVMIGDGFTDWEVKKNGAADRFYAFTEVITRGPVIAKAEAVANSLDDVLHAEKLRSSFSFPPNKMRVLLLENIDPAAAKSIRDAGYTVETETKALSEAELCERIKEVSFLGIRSKTKVTAAVLAHARRLLGVGAFCVGTDQIDLAAAAARGIAVFNAPYSNTRSVVELAIGEIIMLARKVVPQSKLLHEGGWNKSAAGCFEVRGKKIGIIGYGNIGSQLSVVSEALGLEVLFYDLAEKLSLGNAKRCKSLKELLKQVDIVSVHVDGRKTNANLFGAAEFKAMKKGALFVNLSRGHIVDLEALANAIKSGHLGGASVDVYPEEPEANGQKFSTVLQGLTNVILTPHIGGSTVEAQRNIGEFVSTRALAFIETGDTQGSVSIPAVAVAKLRRGARILHVHDNVPGILAAVNSILATYKLNISAQFLVTEGDVGYLVADVTKDIPPAALQELRDAPYAKKVRLVLP